MPWKTRAEAQVTWWGLLDLKPCLASPKNSSLSYCLCALLSAMRNWYTHGVHSTMKRKLQDSEAGPWGKRSWRMKGEKDHSQRIVSEELETSWSLLHAPANSTLTWGLEFSIDEGEQFLADAAVGNRPGQESVVGSGCFQKEIWVWRKVWSLKWRGSGKQKSLSETKLTDIPE